MRHWDLSTGTGRLELALQSLAQRKATWPSRGTTTPAGIFRRLSLSLWSRGFARSWTR